MTNNPSSGDSSEETVEKVLPEHEKDPKSGEGSGSGDAQDNDDSVNVPTWPVQSHVSLDLLNILKAICRHYGIKMAELVRRALTAYSDDKLKIIKRQLKILAEIDPARYGKEAGR